MIGFLNHDINSCDTVDVNQGIQLPEPSVKLCGPGSVVTIIMLGHDTGTQFQYHFFLLSSLPAGEDLRKNTTDLDPSRVVAPSWDFKI